MQSLRKLLFFISLSVIFLMLGSTYFTTYISLKLSSLNTSEQIIGLVHTAFSIGFVFGTLKTESLIEKIGHIKSFIFFGIIFALSIFCNKFFPTIASWIILRFLSGVCLAALYIVIESFYLLISPSHQRGKILAIYMIALYVSQSCSQFFYNILPFESDLIFFLLPSLILISCLPMLPLRNPEIPSTTTTLRSALKSASLSWIGLHTSFASGLILNALYSFLPLLAKKLNLSVSFAMSLMILGGLSFQWPIGLLSDRINRKKLLIGICTLSFIPCLIPFYYPIGDTLSYILIILIGGLSFALYPLAMVLVCENKPKEDLTALTGLIVLLYSFGMIFGPLLTPVFNRMQEVYGLYGQIFLSMLILGLHTSFNLIKKSKKESSIESAQTKV